jgi:hypothetical protein
LPENRYNILDKQYGKEQEALETEISALEGSLEAYEKNYKSTEKFIALIERYENFDNLTISMLNEFIDKILVHERDRKGSRESTQEIEVYFNFIGKYVPPKFMEVDLTPEEQEELRKREETRDRLHRNYLRRKESGKQKEYYERTKAKKKAGIDAKKESIRAEDKANGVFVPVSELPVLKPKKGA